MVDTPKPSMIDPETGAAVEPKPKMRKLRRRFSPEERIDIMKVRAKQAELRLAGAAIPKIAAQILDETSKKTFEELIIELPKEFYITMYASVKILQRHLIQSADRKLAIEGAKYFIGRMLDERVVRAIAMLQDLPGKANTAQMKARNLVATTGVEWGENTKK